MRINCIDTEYVWEVSSVTNLQAGLEKLFQFDLSPEDVTGLPQNYGDLNWYFAEPLEDPDGVLESVLIGTDIKACRAYCIYDGVCSWTTAYSLRESFMSCTCNAGKVTWHHPPTAGE